MFGFHLWDLLIVFFFLFIIALVVGLVLWAVLRQKRVIVVSMNMQQPYAQQPYQGPGQPGTHPPYAGPNQQPDQYPGQPPAHYPPQ